MFNFANITSQFSVNAMFAIVDLQKAIHFDVHVTVHRNKFRTIKPTRCTNFSQFYFGMKLYMFQTVPASIIRSFSLYTKAMVYVISVCEQLAKQDQKVPS